MVFTLVRTDAKDNCNFKFPVGTHFFGRRVLIDCEDIRVSRKHGQLQITEDSITLKALHHNPCFYKKEGSDETHVIKQDNSVILRNGDQFGLLPDTYWYILNYHEEQTSESSKENFLNVVDNKYQNCSTDVSGNNYKQDSLQTSDSELLDFKLNETVNDGARSESPSLIDSRNEESNKNETTPKSNQESEIVHSECRSPLYNEISDEEKNKKVDDGVKSDVSAGPSSPVSKSPDGPASQKLTRERCWYGAQCYRKNPQHKAEFSHPADGDWGATATVAVQCRFGADCRKTDPRHLQDYEHPPKPAKIVKKRERRKKSNTSESDRELSPDPDSRLPAKRKRKTVQSSVGLESGSEEDPFMSDGSDEWRPSSEFKNSKDMSQLSPSQRF